MREGDGDPFDEGDAVDADGDDEVGVDADGVAPDLFSTSCESCLASSAASLSTEIPAMVPRGPIPFCDHVEPPPPCSFPVFDASPDGNRMVDRAGEVPPAGWDEEVWPSDAAGPAAAGFVATCDGEGEPDVDSLDSAGAGCSVGLEVASLVEPGGEASGFSRRPG